MFYVYILRTNKNTLYIGQTNNLDKRLREHNSHTVRSAKYTRAFESCELVYQEEFPIRQDAMKREWELKQLTRAEKEALIKGGEKLLDKVHGRL